MPIAHTHRALFAVLGLAAVFHLVHPHQYYNHSMYLNHHHQKRHRIEDLPYNQSIPLISPGLYLNPRENQRLLKEEGKVRSKIECCPAVLEMIEPAAGENQDGNFVTLYRDDTYKQRFYELSCHPDILNQSCRFMEKRTHSQSRCIQKYSYTYALVKRIPGIENNFPTFPSSGPNEGPWSLDYIKVRSGCACVLEPSRKKRAKKRRKDND